MIDVLLLLALPASGKAEVRRYLEELPAGRRRDELHLGPLVHLTDYSYVHMMRQASQVLRSLGRDGVFFDSDEAPMKEVRDWGTLVELLNEDFDDQVSNRQVEPASAAEWLLDRYDAARARCGADPVLGRLPADVREKLILALEPEAQEMAVLRNASAAIPPGGSTIVIAIARGGPERAALPLPPPLGYQHALARFSDAILSRASILNVRVTPEQALRNNTERISSGPEGNQSVLHHGVPLAVMRADYGCDDLDHLIRKSGRPGTVKVETRGRTWMVPVGRFDNRADRTRFMREDRATWPEASVTALHQGLAEALACVVEAGAPLRD